MTRVNAIIARGWTALGPRFLPFADAATVELPLGRLMRLALFQVSVAMAMVLLSGTLNRVMIVELGVPSSLVALMVALPLVFAPLRTLIGHRSDTHRSLLGWRRVPYIWLGTLLQFGGLAIMPFALLVLSGDTRGDAPVFAGHVGAALAFLLVGAGLHTTQTAGLALATDLAPRAARPRVVAFLYVMLLVGMVASALLFGALLADFSQLRLIQVIQGAAAVTVVLNVIALWKQEARRPQLTAPGLPRPSFVESWREFRRDRSAVRMLVAVGLGTMAFSMQDILLEPYGAEVLHLAVGATTLLTAMFAGGSLIGLVLAAHALGQGRDPYRLAAIGALAGLGGFSALIFAAPLESAPLFRLGAVVLGAGAGLFSVGTLTAAMSLAENGRSGFALGVWGAVQATAAGVAIAIGGFVRDVVSHLSASGALGEGLTGPGVGYSVVYHIEIVLLFATLVAIGPLVRPARRVSPVVSSKFGLAAVPS
jgi:MFS transporter, BCD family, chlorophyll transporter